MGRTEMTPALCYSHILYDNLVSNWTKRLLLQLYVLTVLVSICGNASAFDSRFCNDALGMESGAIPDDAITASSSYVPNVGPRNGRLRGERAGGGWCPKQQVERGIREYIQVDLVDVHLITGIQTQGRFDRGRGQEYAEEYSIEYWREELVEWREYKRWDGKQILRGNSDTKSVESHRLMPPVFASKIRILPYSVHRRTVCLRIELLGCPFEGGILSYNTPNASEVAQGLYDSSYDGVANQDRNFALSGGLGRLVDGEIGADNFRLDIGYGKGNGWVAWKNDSFPNGFVELLFKFDQIRNFTAVHLFTNNFFSRGVQVFSRAKVMFSIGGEFFNGHTISYSYMPDLVLENARNVSINLHHRLGRFVILRLFFADRWIMLSEVAFDSAPVAYNLTEEEEGLMAPEHELIINSIGDKTTLRTLETISARKEGDSTNVEAIIGVLTAMVLLLCIVFAVILLLNRRHKLQASPTLLRNPFGVTINMKDFLLNFSNGNSNNMPQPLTTSATSAVTPIPDEGKCDILDQDKFSTDDDDDDNDGRDDDDSEDNGSRTIMFQQQQQHPHQQQHHHHHHNHTDNVIPVVRNVDNDHMETSNDNRRYHHYSHNRNQDDSQLAVTTAATGRRSDRQTASVNSSSDHCMLSYPQEETQQTVSGSAASAGPASLSVSSSLSSASVASLEYRSATTVTTTTTNTTTKAAGMLNGSGAHYATTTPPNYATLRSSGMFGMKPFVDLDLTQATTTSQQAANIFEVESQISLSPALSSPPPPTPTAHTVTNLSLMPILSPTVYHHPGDQSQSVRIGGSGAGNNVNASSGATTQTPPKLPHRNSQYQQHTVSAAPVVAAPLTAGIKSQQQLQQPHQSGSIINLGNYFPKVCNTATDRKRYHTAPRDKHRMSPPVVCWNIAPSMNHAYSCREAELIPIPQYSLKPMEKIGSCHAGELTLYETENLDDIIPGICKVVLVRTAPMMDDNHRYQQGRIRANSNGASKAAHLAIESLREVRFLAGLSDSPHICKVLGVCTAQQPPWTVLEYGEMGDLAQYLQFLVHRNGTVKSNSSLSSDHSPISVGTLIYMATQIASGMKYLESKHVVHKDLAARNCLVGRGYVVKVADVAMAKPQYRRDYAEIGGRPPAPIRWLPWESILLDRYICASTVWAFAVTFWEIFNFASERPFSNLSNENVIQNAEHMYYGGELQVLLYKPANCNSDIYELLCQCWRRDDTERPTFKQIYHFLKQYNQDYVPID